MRVTREEWYRRVNATWPEGMTVGNPALTADEAVRAAKRLYRFGMKRTWRGPVHVGSGNRYTWIRRGVMTVNPEHGWHQLVHMLSHYCHRRLHPDERPHGGVHARMEIRMIKEVLKRGWLNGGLKSEPKPEPTLDEKRAKKLAGLLARQKQWITRAKRATTALKKLARQIKRMQAMAEVQ